MKPKEVRQKILEAAYEYRHDSFGIQTDQLQGKLPEVDEKTLHQEIAYLEQKNWVDTKGRFMGKQYLNFSAVAITAWGVDLVEDPEDFGKIFSINLHQNNFGDISGSNISINSPYVSQVISQQDAETKKLLEDLLEATKKKDRPAILKALGHIGDKSLDLLVAIIAGGAKL